MNPRRVWRWLELGKKGEKEPYSTFRAGVKKSRGDRGKSTRPFDPRARENEPRRPMDRSRLAAGAKIPESLVAYKARLEATAVLLL